MSRIAVIGATGHVGTYLVPRLVRAGHEVIALSRGEREPYTPAPEWNAVRRQQLDRRRVRLHMRHGVRSLTVRPRTPASAWPRSPPTW